MISDTLRSLLLLLLALMGVSVVVALVGLLALVRRIRRMGIPASADFFTTLRYVPLSLVILLDLLDFGLDIFSAPILWVVLDRMGLPNLRNKATIEALIPFSQPIPTFTLCWLIGRLFDLGDRGWPGPAPSWDARALPRRRPTIIDMDDR